MRRPDNIFVQVRRTEKRSEMFLVKPVVGKFRIDISCSLTFRALAICKKIIKNAIEKTSSEERRTSYYSNIDIESYAPSTEQIDFEQGEDTFKRRYNEYSRQRYARKSFEINLNQVSFVIAEKLCPVLNSAVRVISLASCLG